MTADDVFFRAFDFPPSDRRAVGRGQRRDREALFGGTRLEAHARTIGGAPGFLLELLEVRIGEHVALPAIQDLWPPQNEQALHIPADRSDKPCTQLERPLRSFIVIEGEQYRLHRHFSTRGMPASAATLVHFEISAGMIFRISSGPLSSSTAPMAAICFCTSGIVK